MKIVSIFVGKNGCDGLWSIHLDNEPQNEFRRFFNQVNNLEWLHQFFNENKTDLLAGFFGKPTIHEAALRTLEEVEQIEELLYSYTEQGFNKKGACLQHLFKPLNNFEYAITLHQQCKARVHKGWLRLYAVRLAPNCYLVTGGSIKLTLHMKRPHLLQQISKLDVTKTWLRSNSIDYPEDLNIYTDE